MKSFRSFTVVPTTLALCLAALPGCKDDAASGGSSQTGGTAGEGAGGAAGEAAGGAAGTETPAPTVVHVTTNITSPTTWSPDNLYVLDGSVAVSAVLTIEPGTIVKVADGASIAVDADGSIVADAQSASTPCIFTSAHDDTTGGDTNGDGAVSTPARGDWGGITVREDGTVFNYCRFLYGGGDMPYSGVLSLVDGIAATVTNCTFAHNQGGTPADLRAAALNATGASAVVLTGNRFFDNDVPLAIGSFDVDDSNRFHESAATDAASNTYNGIFWGGSYTVTGSVSWSNTDVPYVISSGPLGVAAGASLTLGDGVVIKLDVGQRIDVSGTLTADGTDEILFTSFLDDSAGGDTNGDAAATTPAPGDWGWVSVAADGSLLNRCRFVYAGNGAPYHGTVAVTADSTATITNCTFAHNAGGTPADNRAAALNLGSAAAGTVVTGNLFYDNEMPLVINGLVDLDGSNVFHFLETGSSTPLTNDCDGIFMDGVNHAVSGSVTWSNQEVPYVMYSTVLTVAETGSLSIGDAVVVKLQAGRIDLIGSLTQGTGDVFTSLLDDASLGDTDGDAGASTPADGDWAGVNICLAGTPCTWATWANILYATNP
jgi:hypothetical protein